MRAQRSDCRARRRGRSELLLGLRDLAIGEPLVRTFAGRVGAGVQRENHGRRRSDDQRNEKVPRIEEDREPQSPSSVSPDEPPREARSDPIADGQPQQPKADSTASRHISIIELHVSPRQRQADDHVSAVAWQVTDVE